MSSASSKKLQQEYEVLRVLTKPGPDYAPNGVIRRLLTDRTFVVRAARYLLNLPMPMETEDRRILEQIVFPYFTAPPGTKSVLFVGCDWYTKHYEKSFFKGLDYWTIDPAPRSRKFAGSQHVVAGLERAGDVFPGERFDLILCNGVYGCGLDSLEQCESAFDACHSILTSGGHLVLGWDDIPARRPVPLAEIASLERFKKVAFPPLGSWRFLTDTPYRHTYDFYRK